MKCHTVYGHLQDIVTSMLMDHDSRGSSTQRTRDQVDALLTVLKFLECKDTEFEDFCDIPKPPPKLMHVYRYSDYNVLCYDSCGMPMPELQGQYDEVKLKIAEYAKDYWMEVDMDLFAGWRHRR